MECQTACGPVSKRGFLDVFRQLNADFFCLQETKLQPDQIQLETPAIPVLVLRPEKGYSGTAIFAKRRPCRSNMAWV